MTQYLNFDTVDVFTQSPYTGNPLAIVHVPQNVKITQEQKGMIAKEFNLSETIFLHENTNNPRERQVDIFISTGQELPFAGHPTIGALCYVGSKHVSDGSDKSIILHEKCGDIQGSYDPATAVALASVPHNVKIHGSATAEQVAVHQPKLASYWKQHKDRKYPAASPVKGMSFLLVDLDSLEVLGKGAPQMQDMTEIYDSIISEEWKPTLLGALYFVVESAHVNDDGVHTLNIRSRMFVSDVTEDPATGSAACTLAAYMSIERRNSATPDKPWQNLTGNGTGSKTRYRYDIVQGVEMGRRSVITVEVVMKTEEGPEIDKMLLQGQAVPVMEGRVRVPA